MPALPPDRPGEPGGTGQAGPGGSGCPRPPGRARPLPDATAVRLYLIPDSAPPYDDETAAVRPPGRGSPDAGDSPGAQGSQKARPAPPVTRDSPLLPPGWPGQFAQVLAETLAGSRPARQLVPWTTERARERIQRLGPRLSAGQQPRIRRVVTFRPTADAMEMTVVVGFGNRVHAMAVRLERAGCGQAAGRAARPGGWLCVAVEAA